MDLWAGPFGNEFGGSGGGSLSSSFMGKSKADHPLGVGNKSQVFRYEPTPAPGTFLMGPHAFHPV